jgi:hypothetical protein
VYAPSALISALCVVLVTCTCVLPVVWDRRELPREASKLGTRVIVACWLACLALAVFGRFVQRDWVHLFWSAQIPLTSLFLCSGVLLERTLCDDASQRTIARVKPAWLFLAMVVSLGVAPLVLEIAWPAYVHSHRDLGRPLARVADLALWGFGGELPESLSPITELERARNVGHLPREVTVAMSGLFIAAWLWIAFSALLLIGRRLHPPRVRRAFLLLSPTAVGITCYLAANVWNAPLGPFDPRMFWPLAAEDSGIWTSEPAVLRSFGPVLAVAAACVVLVRFITKPVRTNEASAPVSSDTQHVRSATT